MLLSGPNFLKLLLNVTGFSQNRASKVSRTIYDTPRRYPEIVLIPTLLASHFEPLCVLETLRFSRKSCYAIVWLLTRVSQNRALVIPLTVYPIHLHQWTAESRITTIKNRIDSKCPIRCDTG